MNIMASVPRVLNLSTQKTLILGSSHILAVMLLRGRPGAPKLEKGHSDLTSSLCLMSSPEDSDRKQEGTLHLVFPLTLPTDQSRGKSSEKKRIELAAGFFDEHGRWVNIGASVKTYDNEFKGQARQFKLRSRATREAKPQKSDPLFMSFELTERYVRG